MMRDISCFMITETIAELCREANFRLPEDQRQAIVEAMDDEPSPVGRAVLGELAENARIAQQEEMPYCQDTGMTVVFAEIGQDVRITGGLFEEAIQAGVSRAYLDQIHPLRASVVRDPLLRGNTGDNTPAVIHTQLVAGDRLRLIVSPKGFGSENMSALEMLLPAAGKDGVKDFVLRTMRKAGPNPCPPVVIGLGIGGTFEKAALLAKSALLLPIKACNPAPHLAQLEEELREAVNQTGIGPAGLGGRTTCLAVHILAYPTHIAGLPVALNMGCHANRHAEAVL